MTEEFLSWLAAAIAERGTLFKGIKILSSEEYKTLVDSEQADPDTLYLVWDEGETLSGVKILVNGEVVAEFNADTKVDKVDEPNQLYGTDENGNPTTYPTDSVGTSVFVDGQKVKEFNADEKQDKLSFDGEYNVETNKAATVQTVVNKLAEIVAGADASYDTLAEIAAWIKEHPKSVAEINALIQANMAKTATNEAAIRENNALITQLRAGVEKAKEIVVVDINKMIDEQDTKLFMDLSQRYANGEIVIVGLLDNQYGIISGIHFISKNVAHWAVTSGAWGEPMLEGGVFKPLVNIYGLECDGEKIVIGMGNIENPDLSDSVKNTDIATRNKAGIVKINSALGLFVDIDGAVSIVPAPNTVIDSKQHKHQVIVPYNMDHAWKVSATTNTETWTDEEKLSVQKLLGVDNRFNIINAILSQSGLVKKYKQPITQEYNERVTADGANVLDGSKAVLKKVEGSTVACENLVDIPYIDASTKETAIDVNFTQTISVSAGELATVSSSSIRFVLMRLSGSSAYILDDDLKNGEIYKRATADDPFVKIVYNGNGITAGQYSKIMISYGTTALPYQPYFTGLKSASFGGIESTNADGTKTSTLNFPKTETPLGTTIDFENKKIIEGSTEVVFDGTEDWALQSINSVGIANFSYHLSLSSVVDGKSICNLYNYDRNGIATAENEGIHLANFYLYVRNKSYTTVEDFKAYLARLYASGNPLTIRYLVATPTETPFTEEQSASGNEYTAYKGGTEKVLENDGAEYGADNTLAQNYILIAEVD